MTAIANDETVPITARIGGDQDWFRGRRMVAHAMWYGGMVVAALCVLSLLSLLLEAPEDDPRELAVLAALSLVALTIAAAGARARRDVRLLDRLQLTVTSKGIAWSGVTEGQATWQEVRHVRITAGRPGRRRLQLDTGRRQVRCGWLRWWRHETDFDLPVDRLNQEAVDVFHLLRLGSGGRFPDQYPPGRFDRPAISGGESRQSTAAGRVVIVGDGQGSRWRRLVSLLAMYVGGAVAVLSLTACVLLVVVTAAVLFLDRGLVSTVASYCGYAATAFGAAVVPYAAGRRAATDYRRLRRLRLEIHEYGITWSGASSGNLAWKEIRHIVLTNDRLGWRRLQVDAGRGPEPDQGYAITKRRDLVELWSTLRRGHSGYNFDLDVPVDRLSREALDVFRLLRSASTDRFPDLYPPARFAPPQHI